MRDYPLRAPHPGFYYFWAVVIVSAFGVGASVAGIIGYIVGKATT